MTTDAIADALLDLASDFGRKRTARTVNIRVFDQAGKPQGVHLVIGPASQLVAFDEAHDGPDPETDDVVRELRRENPATRAPHVVAAPISDQTNVTDYLSFDSY